MPGACSGPWVGGLGVSANGCPSVRVVRIVGARRAPVAGAIMPRGGGRRVVFFRPGARFSDAPARPPARLPPGPPARLPPGPAPAPADPRAADPPVPTVSVRVRVPAEAVPGEELTYRITVTNCSRAAAHHVTVRNPLPGGVRFVRATPEPTEMSPVLLWKLGTLAPCARKEITLIVNPTG